MNPPSIILGGGCTVRPAGSKPIVMIVGNTHKENMNYRFLRRSHNNMYHHLAMLHTCRVLRNCDVVMKVVQIGKLPIKQIVCLTRLFKIHTHKNVYNTSLRRILNLSKYNCTSEMFVNPNIPSFDELNENLSLDLRVEFKTMIIR